MNHFWIGALLTGKVWMEEQFIVSLIGSSDKF